MYFHSNCIVQFPDLTKDNEFTHTNTGNARKHTLPKQLTTDFNLQGRLRCKGVTKHWCIILKEWLYGFFQGYLTLKMRVTKGFIRGLTNQCSQLITHNIFRLFGCNPRILPIQTSRSYYINNAHYGGLEQYTCQVLKFTSHRHTHRFVNFDKLKSQFRK